MQKNALGKGLSSLIGGVAKRGTSSPSTDSAGGPSPAPTDLRLGERVLLVPLTDLIPSPMQPRKTFRDEQIAELMDSIALHGIIQPLTVRRVNGHLELIAGERRFRACQKLGLSEVPVIERHAGDREVLEMALIENLQREDLNPIEEAEAYARLAREFNLKQEEIAKHVGKGRATVANAMRLLELSPTVKDLLSQGLLTTGHAKAILGLRDHAIQNLVADMTVRKGLTVRQTEQEVQKEVRERPEGGKRAVNKTAGSGRATQAESGLVRIQNNLREKLATQVTLHHSEKRGRIEIEYYGADDLSRLLEILGVPVD